MTAEATIAGQARTRGGAASVAIVGGGASGTLTAIHLLASRAHDVGVTVHETSGVLGAGLAYGTTDARHLLNVRSRHMSAFPDMPGDLVDWAARTGREGDAQAFLPRREYAAYLRETLERMADDRLRVSTGRVHDVVAGERGFDVVSESGVTRADVVVLAHGNAAPAPLEVGGRALPTATWHRRDPWCAAGLADLADDATVVLVGTGLTAVDAAVTLLGDRPGRHVVMVSRHGLLPHGHVEQSSTAWVSPVPDGPLGADQVAAMLVGQIEAARRQGVDWRPVVDGLRAPTPSIWRRLDIDERRRFLATYAREWEVRRHRMASDVAEAVAGHVATGRLEVVAGGISGVVDRGARAEVTLAGRPAPLLADAVVNCTGPMTDVGRTRDPLLRTLVDRGTIAPDPLRLGVACTPDGAVLDETGRVVRGLWVVGPPRRGTLWETTAIPEIRAQAAALAQALPRLVREPA